MYYDPRDDRYNNNNFDRGRRSTSRSDDRYGKDPRDDRPIRVLKVYFIYILCNIGML